MPAERPFIHVAHPDPIMAAGIMAILDKSAAFEVVATWPPPDTPSRARVIVADYQEGVALAGRYGVSGNSGPPVLVITSLDKEMQVRRALDAGVQGYLVQDCSADELHDAVRHLAQGLRYVSASIAASIAASVTRALLTPRESDVLRLLGNGHCNKVIARELDIGVGTVKTHIKGLLTKLDAKARTHAVVIAAQRGLIDASTDLMTSR